MKVKVCGLTRTEDVKLAVDLGADLLGFVLAPSPRQTHLKQVAEMVSSVPSTVITVAVVVDPMQTEADEILKVVDRIQFHGNESPIFCSRYGRRALKAFRIRGTEDVDRVESYRGSVGGFVLDSFKKGQPGGTGHTFTWSYLKGRAFGLPTFLAGGLKPDNVEQALQVPEVNGLDLSSGLEVSPGVKDPDLMKEFFARFRADVRNERCKP